MQQPAGCTEQRRWPKEKLQPLEAGSASSQYHHIISICGITMMLSPTKIFVVLMVYFKTNWRPIVVKFLQKSVMWTCFPSDQCFPGVSEKISMIVRTKPLPSHLRQFKKKKKK